MELKGGAFVAGNGWLRRGLKWFKCGDDQKKNGRCRRHELVEEGKGSGGGGGVVSWAEEEGGRVVRMKIVVKKSDLKHLLVEVMSSTGVKGVAAAHHRPRPTTTSNVNVNVNVASSSASTAEQRLNHLLWRKQYLSSSSIAKPLQVNTHKCWSPALQSIPEEI